MLTESRAATAIQAAARGRRTRSEFTWKQSHALGWVRHLQNNDNDSSNPLSEAVDVDYVQSEALLELERRSKKLAKQQAHFADQLRALENLPAVVDKRLIAAEKRVQAAESRAIASEAKVAVLEVEMKRLEKHYRNETTRLSDMVASQSEASHKNKNVLATHDERLKTFDWRLHLLEQEQAADERRLSVGLATASGLTSDTAIRVEAIQRELHSKYTDVQAFVVKQLRVLERRWEADAEHRKRREEDTQRGLAGIHDALATVRSHGLRHAEGLTLLKTPVESHEDRLSRAEQKLIEMQTAQKLMRDEMHIRSAIESPPRPSTSPLSFHQSPRSRFERISLPVATERTSTAPGRLLGELDGDALPLDGASSLPNRRIGIAPFGSNLRAGRGPDGADFRPFS